MSFVLADLPGLLRNPEDIELESRNVWNTHIVCIREMVKTEDKWVMLLQQPGGCIAQSGIYGVQFNPKWGLMRNVYEFLDKPGQFYFDRKAQMLYYFKKATEDMAVAQVVAPVGLETLVKIAGVSPTNRVKNVRFEGITFEYSDWNLTKVGNSRFKSAMQGACSFIAFTDGNPHRIIDRSIDLNPAMIQVDAAEGVVFERNTFRHTGAEGVCLANDVVNTKLVGNVFSDIAGSALVVGHPQHVYLGDGGEHEKYAPGIEGICTNNTVVNNVISDVGVLFPGHPAVHAYYVDRLIFQHNLIKGATYSGVSLGWGWELYDGFNGKRSFFPGKPSTTCRANDVSFNIIVDCMTKMEDGGPVYTLGAQPGTVIRGNVLACAGRACATGFKAMPGRPTSPCGTISSTSANGPKPPLPRIRAVGSTI